MHRVTALVVVGVFGVSAAAEAQSRSLRESAERLASAVELQPSDSSGGGQSSMKTITALAMVGAGVGLAAMAKPDYVPSQFAPGNTPRRVDLSTYLGAGTYPGHSYQLVHRRGDNYGRYWQHSCPPGTSICFFDLAVTNAQLKENYDNGYKDGFDDGVYGGLVVGHQEGWTEGQQSVIQIMDANGLIVYSGEFTPASYVKETFSDKAGLRLAGVGLAAAGAVIALAWPDSPARNLDLGYLPGGARVGASFGF